MVDLRGFTVHGKRDRLLPVDPYRVSIVIPVYQGERTLPRIIGEIAPLTQVRATAAGNQYQVEEVLLVHDGAVDRSDEVILQLARQYSFVKPVWLARNFGQHPATLAGMACSASPWVVTMDEDGQQDPRDIGMLLDAAIASGAQLVYGSPLNAPPHGWVRNTLSSVAKWIGVHVLGNTLIGRFNSFRLLEGEIARSLAAYCGSSVFLDVALTWVVGTVVHVPVRLRAECDHRSGYTFDRLLQHFWRMLVSSGTRPLRFIALFGIFSMGIAVLLTIYALWVKFHQQVPVQGWTSIVIVSSFFSGSILLALGIIAEYLAVSLTIVMGRPLYVIVPQPPRKSTRTTARVVP